ncbi:hypothetical protein [Segnochrobactrum spirostomi]|uniref:Uncharacterized protein n=1 Tax=Segnochrobactrum spirostomi TaxID=2608987 RepID=A0A6A7XZS0_9HYPH|nr:hypothetical protein [Segnochrobactrum spirostomi]MQT11617.1 hypothetical protein [Segnochrobactrum spirostomi]
MVFRSRLSGALRAAVLCAAGLVALAATNTASAAQPTFLTYVDAGSPLERQPQLWASFGGEWRRFTMDTGSTSIAVDSRAIPNLASLPNLGPATLTYGSSGVTLVGFRVLVPVTIRGANGATITTNPIPVLAVSRITCRPDALRCRPSRTGARTAMMGIGYGHGRPDAVRNGTLGNPFIHAADQTAKLGAPVRPGYIVTARGVQVGLAPGDTNHFSLVKLIRRRSGDWSLPNACVAVDGRKAGCGPISVDTGIVRMLVAVPGAENAQKIAVSIGDPAKPAAAYAFSPGDGNPMTPAGIREKPAGYRIFVNPGLHFINGFDVLYDPLQGYAGYRPSGG